MKKHALAIAIALVCSVPAEARSLKPFVYDAELTHFQLDPQLGASQSVVSGDVRINYFKKRVRLSLARRFHCPPNAFCAQVMPAPILVDLPIVSTSTDACGTQVINAREDRRPVDGGLEVLTVRDNTNNHCPHFVALPATEVIYRTISSGMGGYVVKTRSMFSGDTLRPVFDLRDEE